MNSEVKTFEKKTYELKGNLALHVNFKLYL